jgi:hypothetical protein
MFGQKPSFGKPPGSTQDWYLHKQPASQPKQTPGGTPYAGGTPSQRSVAQPAGQAQSVPQPSQGTKYSAYSPRPPSSQTTGDPRGMLANAPPSQRPPPIQMGVAQTPWGPSMDPFAERDAFVRQIGNQRINNQIAFNTSGPNAPQGSPFINYDMARQNAGLGGGAPSMNANPEDTFIGRFNNQFGMPVNPGFGGGQPPAYGQSPAGGGKPWDNNYGQGFGPGVPILKGPGPQRPGSAQPPPPALPPAGYPGFDPRIHGYNPGIAAWGPVQSPAAPTPTSSPVAPPGPAPGSQPRRGRSADIRSPDEIAAEAKTKAFLESSRPGSAQPIAPPPRGSPYNPIGASAPVKAPSGKPQFARPVSGNAVGPAPSHRADEYAKYLNSLGPRTTQYDPERDRQEYEQWSAANPQYSKKLGRHLTAEEQADVDAGWRRTDEERAPAEQARRSRLWDARGRYLGPPK